MKASSGSGLWPTVISRLVMVGVPGWTEQLRVTSRFQQRPGSSGGSVNEQLFQQTRPGTVYGATASETRARSGAVTGQWRPTALGAVSIWSAAVSAALAFFFPLKVRKQ